MFERILIAVDGSEASKRAAEVGIDLASTCGAAVEAIHAVEEHSVLGGEGDLSASRRETGRGVLDSVADEGARRDVTVETTVVEGQPHRVVVDHARESGADLVAMGRHGRQGLEEHLLGSVTERVLRSGSVPVLAVPDVETLPSEFDRILVTTDGSENAERAGPVAASLASDLGASVDVLNVVDVGAAAGVFDAGGVSEEFVERLEREGQEAAERLADRIGDGPEVRTAVVREEAHRGIREYVGDHGVDLVVMASEGQSNLAGQHLGSTTGRVLRALRIPVLVVPDGD